MEENSKPTNDNSTAGTGETSSNLAITIVIVAGILLAAVLLFRAPQEDLASPTPGPGTPAAVQPMATPPTATATQPPGPTTIPPTAAQPTAVQPTIPPVETSPVQGIKWQWVNVTDQSTGQTTTVPDPRQYTIVFTAEGYVNGVADCNSFTGTYSLVSGLVIRINTMTMATCPEGSLDQQYLQYLESVAGGGLDGAGNLALETAGGAQRMLFQNGGAAE